MRLLHLVGVRKLSIDEAVFDVAPSYRRHVVFATGTAPSSTPDGLLARFQSAVSSVQARTTIDSIAADPVIASWRHAFKEAGWNPSKFRSSIEALTRRALRSELSPLGLALVDCGTIATLESGVPIGVHVLDDLPSSGDLVLGPARGSERFEMFDGTVEQPDPGEIVYKCAETVLTRRWVWRQGRVGSVEPNSRLLAINVDVLKPASYDEPTILASLAELLSACGFDVLDVIAMDRDHPEAYVA